MSDQRATKGLMAVTMATLFGGSILGGLPKVDASCFATSKPALYGPERERQRRLSEERLAKAQAKRERKAARKKNLN